MAKRSSSARAKGGRSAAKFVPLNPLGEGKLGISGAKRMTMKLMGAAILLLLIAFFVFASGGGGAYLHVYWAVMGPCLLVAAALLACVIALLYLRGVAPTNWSRLGLTCLMVVVLCVVGAFGISTVYVGATYGEMPVAYLTSPAGERIVIMRSANSDKDPNAIGGYTVQYTGYEMINTNFYLCVSSMFDNAVYSDTELEPKWDVQWLENDDALLYLPDYEGQPHSQTRIVVFDLDDLEASLAEKSDLLSATPQPQTESEQVEPTAQPSPAPSVDPFAY